MRSCCDADQDLSPVLYGVHEGTKTHFYLKEFDQFMEIEKVIGWVDPNAIRKPLSLYHTFHPYIDRERSTVIFAIFIKTIHGSCNELVVYLEDDTFCLQVFPYRSDSYAIVSVKNLYENFQKNPIYKYFKYCPAPNSSKRFEKYDKCERHLIKYGKWNIQGEKWFSHIKDYEEQERKESFLEFYSFPICVLGLENRGVKFSIKWDDQALSLIHQIRRYCPLPLEEEDVVLLREYKYGWETMLFPIDPKDTFLDCHIMPGMDIHIRHRSFQNLTCLQGGLSSLLFNSMEQEKRLPFGEAPNWCRVTPGLNLQGKCDNEDCVAYGKPVWIPKGIGVFEMVEIANIAQCPECSQIANDVNNVGFFTCFYSIEGIRKNNEVIKRLNLRAPDHEFLTFENSHNAHFEWHTLTITTQHVELPEDRSLETKSKDEPLFSKNAQPEPESGGCVLF